MSLVFKIVTNKKKPWYDIEDLATFGSCWPWFDVDLHLLSIALSSSLSSSFPRHILRPSRLGYVLRHSGFWRSTNRCCPHLLTKHKNLFQFMCLINFEVLIHEIKMYFYIIYIIPLLLKLQHMYQIYFNILPGSFNCDCHFFELFYNYYHVFDNFNYSSTKVFLHLSYGAYKSCLRLFWQGKTFEVPLLPAKITIR